MAFIAVLILGAMYEVGPGKTYAALGDVPWETLAPGDVVLVHARPTAYAEKWAMNRQGVTVRGVPDPGGALPVISGTGATTRTGLMFPLADRALVMVTAPQADGNVIESLHFRTARAGAPFTDGDGNAVVWSSGAAAVAVEDGLSFTVRNCVIEDFEKGLRTGQQARGVTVEGNVLKNNRAGGNLELEGARHVVRFNALGVPEGAGTENVRDNSAGAVIAYNFITGGNRVLDIEGIGAPTGSDFARTRVFGNVLIKDGASSNNAAIHFDTQAGGRTLELYANTIVARRMVTRVVNLATKPGLRMTFVNNIVRGPANGTLVLADGDAPVEYGGNWLQTGRVLTQSAIAFTDLNGNLEGDSPGFRDELNDDFQLVKGAAVIDKAIALPMPLAAPVFEFRSPSGSAPRGDDTKPDIGAFEELQAVVTPDGGVPGPKAGLVGWRVCGAAPGPLMVLLAMLRVRRRGLNS